MKYILLFLILFIFFTQETKADKFRLLYCTETEGFYQVSYSHLEVYSEYGEKVADLYTDRYGRITLSLAPGTYNGIVNYRGKNWTVTLFIIGNREVLIDICIQEQNN